MDFKLWSETNKEVGAELRPDFGFRSWDELSSEEKFKIWKHLDQFLFESETKRTDTYPSRDYYPFSGERHEQEMRRSWVAKSIISLNNLYKANSYARTFLETPNMFSACSDFYSIFNTGTGTVVLVLLSLYCKSAAKEREDSDLYRSAEEPDEDYEKRIAQWRWFYFDQLSEALNDVFSHFGLNVVVTRLGFVPRQEAKISKDVFEPVLRSLSHEQWNEVNLLLSDAFLEYRKNTPQGFSNCVTNAISSVQAFLQILVNGRTGKGDISELIVKARKNDLIPSDSFTERIFKEIESILMRERQETGVAHPKKEYATDKNAKLVLNLTMIFFQHCLQG
jgi:hypothetical protein